MFGSLCRVVCLTTLLVSCYGAIDLSQYLKVCDRNSVDINDCMTEAVQQGILTYVEGIEALKIPSIDPFRQKELRIEYKNNQIYAKMYLKDIIVEGVKESTVHDARVKADDDSLQLEIDLSAPKISISGGYEGEGQYNALKINASGTFNTTMSDLVWTWKLDGLPEKVGTDNFMRIRSFYMRPDVGNMFTILTNDNPDSKGLTDLGNNFVNDNWRVMYKELLPYAQANWNKTGMRLANKVFMKIPYDQVLPIGS